MTAPRWWVLLLLSAVFGMHGLQCVGAGGSSMPMQHAAVAAASSSPGHGGWVSVEVTAARAAVLPADVHPSSVLTTALDPTGHGSAGVLVDHLWMVCLAVLAAGLAGLALLLSRIRPGLLAVRRRGAHRWLGSLDPPRPPDIYSLCVLRT